MQRLIIVAAVLALQACSVNIETGDDELASQAVPTVEYLQVPGSEGRRLPYSAAVRAGDTLYLSGMVGIPPGARTLVEGGIQAETRQTLENMQQRLEAFGYSMRQVVKCTVFLADMDEWAAMNEVYTTFFENPPARSAVGASGIALDGRVEIECIAYVGS